MLPLLILRHADDFADTLRCCRYFRFDARLCFRMPLRLRRRDGFRRCFQLLMRRRRRCLLPLTLMARLFAAAAATPRDIASTYCRHLRRAADTTIADTCC